MLPVAGRGVELDDVVGREAAAPDVAVGSGRELVREVQPRGVVEGADRDAGQRVAMHVVQGARRCHQDVTLPRHQRERRRRVGQRDRTEVVAGRIERHQRVTDGTVGGAVVGHVDDAVDERHAADVVQAAARQRRAHRAEHVAARVVAHHTVGELFADPDLVVHLDRRHLRRPRNREVVGVDQAAVDRAEGDQRVGVRVRGDEDLGLRRAAEREQGREGGENVGA